MALRKLPPIRRRKPKIKRKGLVLTKIGRAFRVKGS
jgi:hypothetical protein